PGPIPVDHSAPIEHDLCRDFDAKASRAKAQDEEYDEWLSALDPTMPSSGEGPNRSCYTCAFTSTCRPPDLNSQCGPLNSCIERHCLCDDCFSSESSSGPDLCGCFETC